MITPQDLIAVMSLAVSTLTVIVTVGVARRGWVRDQRHRDIAFEAECVKALCRLITARQAPLSTDQPWDASAGVLANEHHIAAIAAMNAVSASRNDQGLVRFTASQSMELQREAIRYRMSSETQKDNASNTIGARRSAIYAAGSEMQQDLLRWQREGNRSHMKSFWSHYAAALLAGS